LYIPAEVDRDASILPTEFLEKYDVKSKEQNAGKDLRFNYCTGKVLVMNLRINKRLKNNYKLSW